MTVHVPGTERNENLLTVDVYRRGYGRRYTCLPVDKLDRASLLIDCSEGYLRPDMLDLQPGDLVRWIDQTKRIEAIIGSLTVTDAQIEAHFESATLLSPEFFFYP